MIVIDGPEGKGYNIAFPIFNPKSNKLRVVDYDFNKKNYINFLVFNSIFATSFLNLMGRDDSLSSYALVIISIVFCIYVYFRINNNKRYIDISLNRSSYYCLATPEAWAEHISMCSCFVFLARYGQYSESIFVNAISYLVVTFFLFWSFLPVFSLIWFYLNGGKKSYFPK
jgi:hypothetical protein